MSGIPENIRTWTNAQLIEYARQTFGQELSGTKAQILDRIYALAGPVNETAPPAANPAPLSEPQDLKDGDVQVEDYQTIDYFKKYPHVKWLKDAYGRVFKADYALLKTFDLEKNMIPCNPPDYYVGGIGYHGTDPRQSAAE